MTDSKRIITDKPPCAQEGPSQPLDDNSATIQNHIDVGQAMLEKLGYQVLVANGGDPAIEIIRQKADAIDLVILDMIMPGMDGGTTFDRIREIQPAISVILSSGYAINGQATEIMQRGCNGFIQKPFDIFEFSQKIRNILDAS